MPLHCTLSLAGSQRVTTSICPGLHTESTLQPASQEAWKSVSTVHFGSVTTRAKCALPFTSPMMAPISCAALSHAPVPLPLEIDLSSSPNDDHVSSIPRRLQTSTQAALTSTLIRAADAFSSA